MSRAASTAPAVTPVLLDVLHAVGVDPARFVRRHVARLHKDGLLGWQPFIAGRGEISLVGGRLTLASLRLGQNRLGAEIVIGDGTHVSAAGDVAVVTIVGVLPETLILALTGRPFTAFADCGILVADENLILGGTAVTTTGRTWISVQATCVALR